MKVVSFALKDIFSSSWQDWDRQQLSLFRDHELRIFEEEIGEFGEFTHEGDEADFCWFAFCTEALIERA